MTYGGGFVSVCLPVPPPWQDWTRNIGIGMLVLSSSYGPEGIQLSECVYGTALYLILHSAKVFGYGFLNSTGLNCSFEWIGPGLTLRVSYKSRDLVFEIWAQRLSFRGLRFLHTDHVRGRAVRWNPLRAACFVLVYWCFQVLRRCIVHVSRIPIIPILKAPNRSQAHARFRTCWQQDPARLSANGLGFMALDSYAMLIFAEPHAVNWYVLRHGRN